MFLHLKCQSIDESKQNEHQTTLKWIAVKVSSSIYSLIFTTEKSLNKPLNLFQEHPRDA